MSNFVDFGTMFDATFTDGSQLTSFEASVSERCDGFAVLIAPTGVTVTVHIQVQDPDGNWHSVVTSLSVTTGLCLCEVLPFNPGKVRCLITPASGTGSAIIWGRAQGS